MRFHLLCATLSGKGGRFIDILTTTRKAGQRDLSDPGALEDYFQCVRLLEKEDSREARRRSREICALSARYAREGRDPRMLDLHRRALLFDAPAEFDAYCRYIEWERDNPFYMPRRRHLRPLAQALQRLAEGDLELLAISLPPGVGKTTLALFFLTWLGGREPGKPILGGSHSNAFLRGAFSECQRILNPKGEYLWRDVFPDVKLVKSNAEDLFLDLGSVTLHLHAREGVGYTLAYLPAKALYGSRALSCQP